MQLEILTVTLFSTLRAEKYEFIERLAVQPDANP